jgi:hypothetical protein
MLTGQGVETYSSFQLHANFIQHSVELTPCAEKIGED